MFVCDESLLFACIKGKRSRNVVAKKALSFTHFAPNSTLFGVGGEGSLVLVINWKGPNTFDLHCLKTTLFTKLDVAL